MGKIDKRKSSFKRYDNRKRFKDTRTHKIFQALDDVCVAFDLGKPIWLDANVSDFKRHAKTRFLQDNFIEEIEFDYLEIQVIEEG